MNNDFIKGILHELKSMLTDEGLMLFVIGVPLLYPLLYSWIYNNEVVREVPVAVVDQSNSDASRRFIRLFDAMPDVRVAAHSNSLEDARETVGRGETFGVLCVPADFNVKINRMEQAHVAVYCDMSLMLNYKAVFQSATAVSLEMNRDIQLKLAGNVTQREDELTNSPLHFEEVALFNPTAGYGSFILPVVVIMIIQQTILLGMGLTFGTRRQQRLPLFVQRTPLGALGSKTVAYLMVYAVQATFLMLLVPCLFRFTAMPSVGPLLALAVPYLLACIFFAITFTIFVPRREEVMLLVVFTSIPFLFLGGISWPMSNIPVFWKTVGTVIPSTFAVSAFVRVNTMGASISDISREITALWIQTLFYFCTALLVLYRSARRK